jgi:hypothetical protein
MTVTTHSARPADGPRRAAASGVGCVRPRSLPPARLLAGASLRRPRPEPPEIEAARDRSLPRSETPCPSVPGWRCIWPSRPIPRPRAGRSGGRRPTAPTLGICASCLPAGGCRSRGSRRNRWGRCAPGCSCSGTCARSAPPGCSAFTRSCCTKAPRRSPVTCSARTTGVGSRRPRTCHRPASRRSRLHADRRGPGRRARAAAATDRRVCSPPARL